MIMLCGIQKTPDTEEKKDEKDEEKERAGVSEILGADAGQG